ncbi:MAG: DUF4339 domain-containing protein [Planctomycetaceae bacterium]
MSKQFYFKSSTERLTYGPFTPDELRQQVKSGSLKPEDSVWEHGGSKVFLAKDIRGLFPNNPPIDVNPISEFAINTSPNDRDSTPPFVNSDIVRDNDTSIEPTTRAELDRFESYQADKKTTPDTDEHLGMFPSNVIAGCMNRLANSISDAKLEKTLNVISRLISYGGILVIVALTLWTLGRCSKGESFYPLVGLPIGWLFLATAIYLNAAALKASKRVFDEEIKLSSDLLLQITAAVCLLGMVGCAYQIVVMILSQNTNFLLYGTYLLGTVLCYFNAVFTTKHKSLGFQVSASASFTDDLIGFWIYGAKLNIATAPFVYLLAICNLIFVYLAEAGWMIFEGRRYYGATDLQTAVLFMFYPVGLFLVTQIILTLAYIIKSLLQMSPALTRPSKDCSEE